MEAQRGPEWMDRVIAWLSDVLFGPAPAPRPVPVRRDPPPGERRPRGY
ncbi:hypothetical protein [Amaricoccus solimangrovi]|nr:hypothetical protein [Amaricoccus solimangrovi]